jgi:hypothetical protein
MQNVEKLLLIFSFTSLTLFSARAMDSSDDERRYDIKHSRKNPLVEPPQKSTEEELYFIDPVSKKYTFVPYVNNAPNGFQPEDVTRQNSLSNQPPLLQKD